MEEKIYTIIISSLLGEKLSPEEKQTLDIWLSSSNENQKVYKKIKFFIFENKKIRERGGIDKENAWQLILKKKQKRSFKRRFLHYGLDIAALLCIFLSCLFFLPPKMASIEKIQILVDNPTETVQLEIDGKGTIPLSLTSDFSLGNGLDHRVVYDTAMLIYPNSTPISHNAEVTYNRLIVPPQTEYQVVLSDGTRVYMNASSELYYPEVFPSDKREVTLKGEAFFEVSKDVTRKFIVKTSNMNIEVLGTTFNINDYDDMQVAATTLVSGRVRAICKNRYYDLLPGNQIVKNKETGEISVNKVNTLLYTSWKDGFYYFEAQDLEQIMNMLSHWYGFEVIFRNEKLKNIEFSGRLLRYDNIDSFLKKFERVENIHFTHMGNLIIVDNA